MALTLLAQIFSDYTDPDGLVQPHRYPGRSSSGNGLRYTSEAYIAAERGGYLTPEDRTRWLRVIRSCQLQLGLLKRSPIHTDQQGPDDYVAVASAARTIAPHVAYEILAYGRSNPVKLGPLKFYWVYNNVNPGRFHPSAWLGRFPHFVAHFHWAAGETPPTWMRIYAAFAIALTAIGNPSAQDNWVLNWHLIRTIDGRCPYAKFGEAIFWFRFHRAWPGGMRELLIRYFGFEHPLAKEWRD